MLRARLALCVVMLASSLALAAAATAAAPVRLFVDENSIGGRCDDRRVAPDELSAASPLCSVERAVETAPPGARIVLRRGTYQALAIPGGERRLTLRASPGEPVVLQGLSTEDVAGLRVEGLRITGGVQIASGSSGISLVRNDISPRGIHVRTQSANLRFEGNRIHDLAYDAADGLSGYGILLQGSRGGISNVVIKNNRITNIPVDALQVTSVRKLTVEGNEFGDVAREPDSTAHADVVQFLGATDVTFRSNFVHDSVHGILTSAPTERLRLENNLFVRIQNYALQLTQTSSAAIVNNTFWDNGYGVIVRDRATGVTVTNNIFDKFQAGRGTLAYENYNLIAKGDPHRSRGRRRVPRFIAPALGDYGLAPGSAGVDAGSRAGAPARDRLGRRRVDDPRVRNRASAVDLGAEEYVRPASSLRRLYIAGIKPRGGRRTEAVRIVNRSRASARLRGATLRDGRGDRLSLPRRLTLPPRGVLTVRTVCGRSKLRGRRRVFRACAPRGIWDDRGDAVRLVDRRGVLVSQRGYGRLRSVARF